MRKCLRSTEPGQSLFAWPFAPLLALPAAAQGEHATPFVFSTLAANVGPTCLLNPPGAAPGLALIELYAIP
jgi:hypothetical protein